MSVLESLPLIVLALLLISAGGASLDTADIVFDGRQQPTAIDDVLLVAGGEVSIDADVTVQGRLYLLGGSTRIAGTVDGDVTVLAGNLTVASAGTITGSLQEIAGQVTLAEGATVGRYDPLPVVPEPSPARRYSFLLVQMLGLGLAGAVVSRRWPGLLPNISHAITDHTLVSGVVGALVAVTLLVLFVYMAFTLLLLPISILGLVGQVVVVMIAHLAFGNTIGRRLPLSTGPRRTAAGIALFVLALELLGWIPYLGALVQLGLLAVGFGAVILTYVGLRRFEPPAMPGGGNQT